MRRTGFEHAIWDLAKQVRTDRAASGALVGLWIAGWLALALALFAPLG